MLLVLTLLRDVLLLLAWPFAAAVAGRAHRAGRADAGAGGPALRPVRRPPHGARCATSTCPSPGLPAALHGFTIAQITDLHVGPTVKRRYVQAIVDAVNRLGADAVAVTGDLVDGRVHDLQHDVAPLAGLRSRHGTYFVTGNHEYYSGVDEWTAALRALGLRVLINEHVVLEHDGARLVMAGVADFGAGHFDPSHRSDPQRRHGGAPADAGLRVLAGASAAQRAGRGRRRLRRAAVRPHPRRPVLAVEPVRAAAAAVHRRTAPAARAVGLHQPRHRLLGTAAAPGRASEITRLRFVADRG